MTEYRILWTASAEAQLRALDIAVQLRIQRKVRGLANNPERALRRLVNSPLYRLRVGDYRVIVALERATVVVVVLQVVHRRSAYGRVGPT